MSHERPKRKKLPFLPEALAAGIALGSQIPMDSKQAKAEDPIGNFIQQDIGKYSEHNPRGEVEDRRMETKEHAYRLDFSELEPDPPINDDLATSSLAAGAGADHIEAAAEHDARERKALAAKLAKKAHDAWQREREKKNR